MVQLVQSVYQCIMHNYVFVANIEYHCVQIVSWDWSNKTQILNLFFKIYFIPFKVIPSHCNTYTYANVSSNPEAPLVAQLPVQSSKFAAIFVLFIDIYLFKTIPTKL